LTRGQRAGTLPAHAARIPIELTTLACMTPATFAALDVVTHLRTALVALAAQQIIHGFIQQAAHALPNPVPRPCLAFLDDLRKERNGVDMPHFCH
jgi:hypothetical protein